MSEACKRAPTVLRAREELREGPHVIGWALGVAASTVHAVLRRHGRSRLHVLAPHEEIVRYERAAPGELVHVDIEKLGPMSRSHPTRLSSGMHDKISVIREPLTSAPVPAGLTDRNSV